jgi:hypothetical protein
MGSNFDFTSILEIKADIQALPMCERDRSKMLRGLDSQLALRRRSGANSAFNERVSEEGRPMRKRAWFAGGLFLALRSRACAPTAESPARSGERQTA